METTATNLTLTAGQLAAFLRPLPGEPGVLSPLQSLGLFTTSDASASLPETITRQRDVWAPIARTLFAPKLALVTSAGTSDNVVYLHAFGAPTTCDHLVGCTRAPDGTFEIVPTLTASVWSQVLWDGLALDTVTPAPDAAVSMSITALTACCGLVDAIKESRLEALIAREDYPASCATTASIALAAKTGLMTQDACWFTGLMRRLLPQDPGGGSLEQTRQGLNELAHLGWVISVGDDEWSFAETMQPNAIEWGAAAVSGLFSLHLDDPDGLNRLHVGIIRTLSGLWTLECPPLGETVKVGRTGGQALMLTMMKAVKTLLASWPARPVIAAASKPVPAGSLPAHFCPSCGAAVVDGARFCAECGKPVQMPEVKPVCPGCGKPVHAGEKFCGTCGHRIA